MFLFPCSCGSPQEAENAIRPMHEFGSPLADMIQPMRYCEVQQASTAQFIRHQVRTWRHGSYSSSSSSVRPSTRCGSFRCRTSMYSLTGLRWSAAATTFSKNAPDDNSGAGSSGPVTGLSAGDAAATQSTTNNIVASNIAPGRSSRVRMSKRIAYAPFSSKMFLRTR